MSNSKKLNSTYHAYSLSALLIFGRTSSTSALNKETELDLKFAGAQEFSDKGILFVGDYHHGAVYAFEKPAESTGKKILPRLIVNIDAKIVTPTGVTLNKSDGSYWSKKSFKANNSKS